MTTIQIDPIEHDIYRDETLASLNDIEDVGVVVSRAHGVISGAVMALISELELSSVLEMLKLVSDTATEACSGMVEQ